jgi:hypothetical protein
MATYKGQVLGTTDSFGSKTRFSGVTSRTSSPGKENIPTSPLSSHIATSPYTRSSSPFIPSADILLALQLCSDNYEKKYRNLMRKVSRAADCKAEIEKRVHNLQEELCGVWKTSSQFVTSLQRQLDHLSAELIQQKKNEYCMPGTQS